MNVKEVDALKMRCPVSNPMTTCIGKACMTWLYTNQEHTRGTCGLIPPRSMNVMVDDFVSVQGHIATTEVNN